MPHLTKLTATENKLTNIDFFSKDRDAFQFLQVSDFKDNKIKLLPQIHAPSLKHLILTMNEINSCAAFKGHCALQVLELRKN